MLLDIILGVAMTTAAAFAFVAFLVRLVSKL